MVFRRFNRGVVRLYVGSLLMGGGIALLVWAIVWGYGELRRSATDLGRAVALARFLRTAILGLALIGTVAGWLWHLRPLVLASLVIAGEELLETSVVVAALAAEARRRDA